MRPSKRSFSIKGHKTSISLEPQFWEAFREIADRRNVSLASLVAEIDSRRSPDTGLSTAVRLFILETLIALARPSEPVSGTNTPKGPSE